MRLFQMTLCLLFVSFVASAFAQDENTAPAGDSQAASQSQQQADSSATEAEPEDEGSTIEKASLLIGFNTISRMKQQGADYDFEQIIKGMRAADEGQEIGMTREAQQSVLRSYQTLMRRRITEKRKAEAERNRIEGEQAIAEFMKQEGAQELEEGVYYIVVEEGDGESPEAPDRVRVNYVGKYPNGEVFDSSIDKGQPLENGVTQFVPGFSNALQKMKVGGKWKVIIRGDKAYGMRPRPPMELNKTLLFDIDLLEIMPIK